MSRLQEYLEKLQKPDLGKPAFKINPKAADRIVKGLCADCESPIREEDFRDENSKREYGVSGLCQQCQDEIFGK